MSFCLLMSSYSEEILVVALTPAAMFAPTIWAFEVAVFALYEETCSSLALVKTHEQVAEVLR